MRARHILVLTAVCAVVLASFAGCRRPFATDPVCQNGVLEMPEECDGAALNGLTCADFGFTGGTLGCTALCVLDTSQCTGGATCGDGVADPGEECDGADLGGASCVSLGWDMGALACGAGCLYDETGCASIGPTCGNGAMDPGEDCDGADFGGADCVSLGFDLGTLLCSPTCSFNTGGCSTVGPNCGDGTLDPGEACDGLNLGGATCVSLGYTGGTLTCTAGCTHNTGGCTTMMGMDLVACGVTGPRVTSTAGQLTCADSNTSGEIEWDVYEVTASAGDCVDIFADNVGVGAADLLAAAIDAAGGVYGLEADYSELDDEVTCSVMPWQPYACPGAAVTAGSGGTFTITVGQWGGGCAAGLSDYQLFVAINGVAVTPALVANDAPTSVVFP